MVISGSGPNPKRADLIASSSGTEPSAPRTGPEVRNGETRILLVEDSRLLQERLTEMLTDPGEMRVHAAVDTEQDAIRAIETAEFDVLLVDVELKSGSGIGVIAHARRSCPPDRQPLIIVLTNYPLPVVRSRCLAAGADHFLDKMREFQKVKALISAAPGFQPH